MANIKEITVIGYGSGIAANNPDCGSGPLTLKKSAIFSEKSIHLVWWDLLVSKTADRQLAAIKEVAKLNHSLARKIQQLVLARQKFLVLGGDHTAAIGTWSGAASALRKQGPLGLIWIDAHMDSHTPETTESGNIHGMPLACLLGYGPGPLTEVLESQPKLLPWHVCLIGVRSFEQSEADLLKRLNIRVFFMEEVKSRGLAAVFADSLQIVKRQTAGYGISIDLDAMDPADAPGVGKPEADGLSGAALCEQLEEINQDQQLLGLEIVEFNPLLDQAQKTERLIADIIAAVFL
jgi:arginase